MKARIILTAILLTAAVTAKAETTWTVSNPTGSTFRITRSTSGTTETVKYRTVNLSAYAGQHYTAASGEVTFGVNDTYKEVTVTENTPTTAAYKYQTGDMRKYRFDVTDQGGFHLAHLDREITTGTSFSDSYVNKSVTDLVYFQSGSVMSGSGNKYLDVAHSGTNGTEKMIDDDYDYNNNTLCTVSTSDLYNNDSDLRSWLNSLHYKMYATVYFQQREVNDGYQYIQILADNASTYDGKDGDGKIDNGPTTSLYKAAFILSKNESVCTSWKYQLFPHRYDYHTGSTEFDYSDSYLYSQKFQSSDYSAANSGSLVLDPTVNDINVRFDANGSGDDTWYLKNLKVRLALVDSSSPSVLAYSVAPGRHSKGNTLYVSVAFNEIVTTTDAQLTSSWGMLSYVDGSGSNVLTFNCTIPANASGSLIITSYSGTIQDLVGNSLGTNAISENNLCSVDASYAYTITYNLNEGTLPDGYPTTYTYNAAVTLDNPARFGYNFIGWTGSNGNTPQTSVTIAQYSHGNKSYTANWTEVWTGSGTQGDPYTITDTQGLDLLAQYVNSGNDCYGVYFQLGGPISYSYTKAWNNSSSTDNNYTAIGTDDNPFQGTFDGQGFTISGIRVYNSGVYDKNTGIFGVVNGGTVRRVNLANTRMMGLYDVGGIAGTNQGTIEDCIVGDDVCIDINVHNGTSYYHGGIVGSNHGTVQRCISRVCLTTGEAPGSYSFGGIVGYNESGTIIDCIADGAIIPGVQGRGAIAGYKYSGTLTRNYYRACTVAGVANATGAGVGNDKLSYETSDVTTDQGALPIYAITLPANASLTRSASATLPGSGNKTYTTGADIAGASFAVASSSILLSYDSSSLPSGSTLASISAKETSSSTAVAVTDNGDYTYSFTMPAADVTVTATIISEVSYIDENGTEQTCSNFIILSDETIYINDYDWGIIGINNQDTWYVAVGDYTFSNHNFLRTNGHVHLILCDGATFTVSGLYDGISASDLTIYGQSEGTGRLVASSTHAKDAQGAIYFTESLTINGGIISTSSESGKGILGANSRPLTINGGNIHATGAAKGIYCAGDITLGWTRATDRIYASSYDCGGTISIKEGQTFSNGTEVLAGTITNMSKLDDKTLVPSNITPVAYIDADGSKKYCTDYTVIDGSETVFNTGGWYVVSGDVQVDGLLFDGNTNIILCDGSHLNCSNGPIIVNNANICLYAQSGGAGRLTVNYSAPSGAIQVDNFTLNGGNVNAINNTDISGGYGIYASGDVTINGGSLTATCTTAQTGFGIYANGSIVINGGNVTASGSDIGIFGYYGTITLGWTKNSDSIYASGFYATAGISIKSGQAFNNGTEVLSDTVTDMSKLDGKTLRPSPVGGDASASLTAHAAWLVGEYYYWATFYHATWNYRLPAGTQAFIMKSDNVLYRIGDGTIVPAGCAVVIMIDNGMVEPVEPGTGTITLTATTDVPVGVTPGLLEANILRGVSTDTVPYDLITGNEQVFVLGQDPYSDILKFRRLNSSTVPAHKAYYLK